MSKIKIEVGKRYVAENGQVFGPMIDSGSNVYPFRCENSGETFTRDGSYFFVRDGASTEYDLDREHDETPKLTLKVGDYVMFRNGKGPCGPLINDPTYLDRVTLPGIPSMTWARDGGQYIHRKQRSPDFDIVAVVPKSETEANTFTANDAARTSISWPWCLSPNFDTVAVVPKPETQIVDIQIGNVAPSRTIRIALPKSKITDDMVQRAKEAGLKSDPNYDNFVRAILTGALAAGVTDEASERAEEKAAFATGGLTGKSDEPPVILSTQQTMPLSELERMVRKLKLNAEYGRLNNVPVVPTNYCTFYDPSVAASITEDAQRIIREVIGEVIGDAQKLFQDVTDGIESTTENQSVEETEVPSETGKLVLREGGYYRDRSGKVHGPLQRRNSESYPFLAATNGNTWTASGRWWTESDHHCAHDLIEEVPAPVADQQEAPVDPLMQLSDTVKAALSQCFERTGIAVHANVDTSHGVRLALNVDR